MVPLKMTVVEMTRKQLRDAIDYSRTNVEKGKSSAVLEGDERIERRGYLQVDFDYWRSSSSSSRSDGESGFDDDQILSVAVPRNLLKGELWLDHYFCFAISIRHCYVAYLLVLYNFY